MWWVTSGLGRAGWSCEVRVGEVGRAGPAAEEVRGGLVALVERAEEVLDLVRRPGPLGASTAEVVDGVRVPFQLLRPGEAEELGAVAAVREPGRGLPRDEPGGAPEDGGHDVFGYVLLNGVGEGGVVALGGLAGGDAVRADAAVRGVGGADGAGVRPAALLSAAHAWGVGGADGAGGHGARVVREPGESRAAAGLGLRGDQQLDRLAGQGLGRYDDHFRAETLREVSPVGGSREDHRAVKRQDGGTGAAGELGDAVQDLPGREAVEREAEGVAVSL